MPIELQRVERLIYAIVNFNNSCIYLLSRLTYTTSKTVNMANSSLESRELFANCIKTCGNDVKVLKTLFDNTPGNETDKKSILEQAFRDVLQDEIVSDVVEIQVCTQLIELSIFAAQCAISYYTVPFILLGDVFDCFTLDTCEEVFGFVESRVSTWTLKDFSSGKTLLLRMCNDLLRRLSSAQNTVFCGRIQLFLARLFPLSEKSALNLMSHFNLENVTSYNTEAGLKDNPASEEEPEKMDIDEQSDENFKSSVPIDYNLYHKLWSLQDAFRQPTQAYNSDFWKMFTANVQEVLQAFSSYKLEDTSGTTQSRSKVKRAMSTSEYRESHYFAKFLTSEKLMSLQLQDSHFRRHILIQLLVLFQYLTTDTKFKTAAHVMSDSNTQWIKETTEEVYKLIEETPPNGAGFAVYIKRMLKNEVSWIAWKNDGCPLYEKSPLPDEDLDPYPPREHLGDKVRSGSEKIDMGSTELSRLWNLCPDNLQACKLKTRNFVPDVKGFLEEPIEQADPEARIEAEYKMINNQNFTWQALRLLSQRSSHFFQNTTAPIKQIPDFLEHVMVLTIEISYQR